MQLLDGRSLAKKIKDDIKDKVSILKKERSITPGLAVILVGDDKASQTYVTMKAKACKETGIYSITHEMPSDIEEERILETIKMINQNSNIDGILIQLPLPKQIDSTKLIEAIDPKKDVDGFHPQNIGRLQYALDCFMPATPLGVIRLLDEYGIELRGKNVVIVGASNIVGKPMGAMFLNRDATVEITHIYTKNLKEHTKRADILVVGVGKSGLITKDMVKEGAVVVDIGINKLENGEIVGDVDFEGIKDICSYITPVPGGVGPMTIATLLQNTLKSALKRESL